MLIAQAEASKQLREQVTKSLSEKDANAITPDGGREERTVGNAIKIQKMTPEDMNVLLNHFKCTTQEAGWPKAQWTTVLIPCSVGPAQNVVDNLPAEDLTKYARVHTAILQTLNLSSEVGLCSTN